MTYSMESWDLIHEALWEYEGFLTEMLSHTNASDREWQRVSDIAAIRKDLETFVLVG